MKINVGLKYIFKTIKLFVKPIYLLYCLIYSYWMCFYWTFFGNEPDCFYEIPIIINNFNRLTFLKQLIEALVKRGYHNINIIDNGSTYQPLLEYYDTCPYKIFRLNKNVGYLTFWKTGIYKHFQKNYFVYTDSDLLPHCDCPNNFMKYFYHLMMRYKNAQKIGFGLMIDDLPDYYKNKQAVIDWEKQFFEKELEKNVYRAMIDTTFALYRPFVKGGANKYLEQIRTGKPYMMHHLPWYIGEPTNEDIYYLRHIKTATHWSNKDNI